MVRTMFHNDWQYSATVFYQLTKLQKWLDILVRNDKIVVHEQGLFFHTLYEMLNKVPFEHILHSGYRYTEGDAYTSRQPVWDGIDAVLSADVQGSQFATRELRVKWLQGLLSLVHTYGVFRNAVTVFKREMIDTKLSFGEGQEASSDVVVISNDEFVGRKALETLSTLVPKLITALEEYRKGK